MNKLEQNIKELFEKCKCSVCIEYNKHKDVYQSIEENIELDIQNGDVDKEMLDEMIKRDEMIRIQFYPDTPIGFYIVFHYDLEKAIDKCLEVIKIDRD